MFPARETHLKGCFMQRVLEVQMLLGKAAGRKKYGWGLNCAFILLTEGRRWEDLLDKYFKEFVLEHDGITSNHQLSSREMGAVIASLFVVQPEVNLQLVLDKIDWVIAQGKYRQEYAEG